MVSDTMMYPILGVGAFFAMFWVGFVCAYSLGLPCALILTSAFLAAVAGANLVVRLERWERGSA